MSYSATSPSRLGLASGGSDNDALFLKVFSGEVLTTFEENNVMMGLHRVRTISSGKSAQFPVSGVAGAKYHTPGESVLVDSSGSYLSNINHNERVISIDNVLTSSAFIADIDEAKNHYDVRSMYSTEIGRQLGYHADRALIRTVIAGARKITDRFGTTIDLSGDDAADLANSLASKYLGNRITIDGAAIATHSPVSQGAFGGDTNNTAGVDLFEGIFKAAELMDSRNVAKEGRYCLLSPSNYYKLLVENKDAIDRDFNPEGNGSIAEGSIIRVAGVTVIKSNHIPDTNESSDTTSNFVNAGINNDVFGNDGVGYGKADFSKTAGVVFQSEAVGTVKLMDLSLESEYVMERMGTLMLAKYAMGHGVLREECCYELVDNG